MLPLEKEVLKTVRERGLLSGGGTVLVAVSGGADSLALLHLLWALREKCALNLEVLHFNHGLREAAGRDAAWVKRHAAGLGLPFHLRRTTRLKTLAGGVQEAAREWRRGESLRLIDRGAARWVATGHQRDDQSETILLKLLRGGHLGNLRGMEWLEGPFVRPLLDITHSRLTAYLQGQGVDWLEDPSNRDPRYKRNRVRHELLPLMAELAGGDIAGRLSALAEQAGALRELLNSLPSPQQSAPGESPGWISADSLAQLPEMAATTALHAFVTGRSPGEVDFPTLRKAVQLLQSDKTEWTLHLSKARTLKLRGGRLMLADRTAETVAENSVWEGGGWRIEAPADMTPRVCGSPCGGGDAMTLCNLPAGAALLVRRRLSGDRFHPPWKEKPVKVKDFLRDQHVPAWERDRLPCVVLDGRVIAIYPNFVARGFDRPVEGGRELCIHFSRP